MATLQPGDATEHTFRRVLPKSRHRNSRFRHPDSMQEPEILCGKGLLLASKAFYVSAQYPIGLLEFRNASAEPTGRVAGELSRRVDLVEDVAVCCVERIPTSPSFSSHRGRRDSHGSIDVLRMTAFAAEQS